MRICSIASGSSGNCIYVGSDATHLLVDAGISGKRVEEGLKKLDLSMWDIDGIFVTHEHVDHIAGLGVIGRKYGIPIYATQGTIKAVQETSAIGVIPEELFCPVSADEKITVKDISLIPMKISHDAMEPVGYRISHGKKKVGIATDLGTFNDYTVECLKGMDVLFLEANHDVNMLQVGSYPYHLKQRIMSDRGHLSNEKAGELLCKLLHDGLQAVVLGHLSKENNLPELAYEAVRVEIVMANRGKTTVEGEPDLPIYVAERSEPSALIHIT